MPFMQQAGRNVSSISRVTFVGAFRFIIRHWYLFILLFSILPTVISSIQVGIETNNPSHPFVELGITLVGADSQIYEDVNILRDDPEDLLGEKNGSISSNMKYYWNVLLLAWKILGNLFLISVPFVFFYRAFSMRQTSEPAKNTTLTILIGVIFMLVINLILGIINIVQGDFILDLPAENIYLQAWTIILTFLPFHGVINLILFLVGI